METSKNSKLGQNHNKPSPNHHHSYRWYGYHLPILILWFMTLFYPHEPKLFALSLFWLDYDQLPSGKRSITMENHDFY